MDKKIFEESLIRLFPGCSGETVQRWFSFAEECIEMGQSPDFLPVSDRDIAAGKWLEAIYKGLYRAGQELWYKACGTDLRAVCKTLPLPVGNDGGSQIPEKRRRYRGYNPDERGRTAG